MYLFGTSSVLSSFVRIDHFQEHFYLLILLGNLGFVSLASCIPYFYLFLQELIGIFFLPIVCHKAFYLFLQFVDFLIFLPHLILITFIKDAYFFPSLL